MKRWSILRKTILDITMQQSWYYTMQGLPYHAEPAGKPRLVPDRRGTGMIRPVKSVHQRYQRKKNEKWERKRGEGGRWEPPEGFQAPYHLIGLSREQERERERSEGGRRTYRTDGASVARLPMAGEPTSMAWGRLSGRSPSAAPPPSFSKQTSVSIFSFFLF